METGYTARFGDVADLARGVATLLGDPELLGRLGRRCREVAEGEFPVDLQVRRYVALYEELRPSLRPGRSRPSDAAASRVEPGTR